MATATNTNIVDKAGNVKQIVENKSFQALLAKFDHYEVLLRPKTDPNGCFLQEQAKIFNHAGCLGILSHSPRGDLFFQEADPPLISKEQIWQAYKLPPKLPSEQKEIIISEVDAKLSPLQRKGLIDKFLTHREAIFEIEKQHPTLRKYYEFVKSATDASPQGLITAFLSALATNIGNRAFIRAHTAEHYCNIWTINIAPSTIGRKTTSLNLPLSPLQEWEKTLYHEWKAQCTRAKQQNTDEPPAPCVLFPTSTPERFYEILEHNPVGLMVFSEIASFFAKMNKSYMGDFKADLTAMYDTPKTPIKHETRTRQVYIEKPCFSIAAATTKEWFLKELETDQKNDIHSGFIQRFLVCNSYKVDIEKLDFRFKSGFAEATKLHNWLSKLYNGLRLIGQDRPVELQLSEEAKKLYETINKRITTQLYHDGDDILLSYAGRIFDGYFLRFCILFSCLDVVEAAHNTEHLETILAEKQAWIVSEVNAAHALLLCHYYFESVRSFLKNDVEENLEAANDKKLHDAILRVIDSERLEDKMVSHSLLKGRIRMTKREFDTSIQNLIEQEVICPEERDIPGKGRTYIKVYYRYLL